MLIGYARVSTDDQNLDVQRAALLAAGCQRIFEEKVSGAKRDRFELTRMLEHLRDSDVVVATRLDRLARSTKDLLDLVEIFKRGQRGVKIFVGTLGRYHLTIRQDGPDRFCRYCRV